VNEQDDTTWDIPGISEYLEHICLKPGDVKATFDSLKQFIRDAFKDALIERSVSFYEEREKMITDAGIDMREFERVALLGAVDRRWMDHIDAMDQLRDGIGLRAYGHKNPIVEYKIEGFEMFEEMIRMIQEDTLRRLYMAVLVRPPERKEVATPVAATHGSESTASPKKPAKAGEKVGRNAPCPCGSGKKYKECCGKGQ
jgi:preprotein translocase subunit SecA